MRSCWVPGVNNLGKFGRWAFAEFTSVFEIDADFAKLIQSLATILRQMNQAPHHRTPATSRFSRLQDRL